MIIVVAIAFWVIATTFGDDYGISSPSNAEESESVSIVPAANGDAAGRSRSSADALVDLLFIDSAGGGVEGVIVSFTSNGVDAESTSSVNGECRFAITTAKPNWVSIQPPANWRLVSQSSRFLVPPIATGERFFKEYVLVHSAEQILWGQAVFEDGTPASRAEVNSKSSYAVTDVNGYFSIRLMTNAGERVAVLDPGGQFGGYFTLEAPHVSRASAKLCVLSRLVSLEINFSGGGVLSDGSHLETRWIPPRVAYQLSEDRGEDEERTQGNSLNKSMTVEGDRAVVENLIPGTLIELVLASASHGASRTKSIWVPSNDWRVQWDLGFGHGQVPCRVVDADSGRPIPGVKVAFYEASSSALQFSSSPILLSPEVGLVELDWGVTDENGAVVLAGKPAEIPVVGLLAQDNDLALLPIGMRLSETHLQGDELLLRTSSGVCRQLLVRSSSGEPVVGAGISVRSVGGGGGASYVQEYLTGERGEAFLLPTAPGLGFEVTIYANVPFPYETGPLTFPSTAPASILVELGKGGRIVGAVPPELAPAGESLELHFLDQSRVGNWVSAMTSGEAEFESVALAEGYWIVLLRSSGGQTMRSEILQVRDGETSIAAFGDPASDYSLSLGDPVSYGTTSVLLVAWEGRRALFSHLYFGGSEITFQIPGSFDSIELRGIDDVGLSVFLSRGQIDELGGKISVRKEMGED